MRRKLEIPAEAKVVVFTGRLVSYKGLPTLLRVWEKVHPQHPSACLILVGSGGMDIQNCEADLREYVARNRLEQSVRFTGAVENVQDFLQAADLFVLPTENEAFGLSLIEAMACGLAVISTSVGGVRDILHNEDNGLVVRPGDPEELRGALDYLLTNPSLRARLGERARQTVAERYSSERIANEYFDLFRDLAQWDPESVPIETIE